MTGLAKILSHDVLSPLRSLTVLPLMLSPEKDDALWQLTEGRIPVFSHDLVPDYLRTKPDPVAETRMLQYEQKANNLAAETALKNVAKYNKVVTHVYDMLNKAKEEWEIESQQRAGIQQTSSISDTNTLVAAISLGKNLKPGMTGMPQGPGEAFMRPRLAGPQPMNPQGPMGRAPSAIKTNIKAANQIHPYNK